ncbi:MAG: hypothetical protein ACPGUF_05070, partial [Litorivicinus sp.]
NGARLEAGILSVDTSGARITVRLDAAGKAFAPTTTGVSYTALTRSTSTEAVETLAGEIERQLVINLTDAEITAIDTSADAVYSLSNGTTTVANADLVLDTTAKTLTATVALGNLGATAWTLNDGTTATTLADAGASTYGVAADATTWTLANTTDELFVRLEAVTGDPVIVGLKDNAGSLVLVASNADLDRVDWASTANVAVQHKALSALVNASPVALTTESLALQVLTLGDASAIKVGDTLTASLSGATGQVIAVNTQANTVLINRLGTPSFTSADALPLPGGDLSIDVTSGGELGLLLPFTTTTASTGYLGVIEVGMGLTASGVSVPTLELPVGVVDFIETQYANITDGVGNVAAALENLTYADVIRGLVKALDVLFGEDGNSGLMAAELPFLGDSLGGITGLNGIKQELEALLSKPGQAWSDVGGLLEGILNKLMPSVAGVSPSFNVTTESTLDPATGISAVRLGLSLEDMKFDRSLSFGVDDVDLAALIGTSDLGPLSFEAGGTVTAQAKAEMNFDLLFEIDTNVAVGAAPIVNSYLGENTGISVALDALSFTPTGETTLDLELASGTVRIADNAEVGLYGRTVTVKGLDSSTDYSAWVGQELKKGST